MESITIRQSGCTCFITKLILRNGDAAAGERFIGTEAVHKERRAKAGYRHNLAPVIPVIFPVYGYPGSGLPYAALRLL